MLVIGQPTAPEFDDMVDWIVASQTSRNIQMVAHVGDITGANTGSGWETDYEQQFDTAATVIGVLDTAGVPSLIACGNHDYDGAYNGEGGGCLWTHFTEHFPLTRISGKSWYGGRYYNPSWNEVADTYFLFSASGKDYVIVGLSHTPISARRLWARDVLQAYPNRVGILITHAYCDQYGSNGVEGSATHEIWDDIAETCPNLLMILCGNDYELYQGHRHRVDDTVVWEWMRGNHVTGQDQTWLRVMRFYPATGEITVKTYSPHQGIW